MTEQYFGLTDTGKARQNNEDAFIARQSAGNRFIIACVIDGVGGYAGGEVAARLAREAILERLEKPSGEIVSLIIDCFELANQRIIRGKQQNKDHSQMSCVSTLALADIVNNQFYYAHVGDTRLYLLRDKSLVKISHDQSFVGFLEESGRLSEEEAMNHPKRNEINKALGFEGSVGNGNDYIETGQSPFLPGDLLLLCSDGLSDMINSAEITRILTRDTSLKEKGRQLIDAANQNGGRDNITVVLVKNDKAPAQHTATAVKQREPAADAAAIDPAEQPAPDEETEPPAAKTGKGIIAILSVLVILLLASSIYFYLQTRQTGVQQGTPQPQPVAVAPKPDNRQALKVQQAINSVQGNVLVLADSSFKTPIILSDAIKINKDSLLIRAKGNIVFQGDSAYRGPAFRLSAKCKSIVIDSVSFSNFQTGIILANSALELKNVRFTNVVQGVQNQLVFADKKYISGRLPGPVMQADSAPLTIKK